MAPEIKEGGFHSDQRGTLFYNNEFDATEIKRFYAIENKDTSFVRAWQGHKIEQRWFSAVAGSFEIRLVEIDNWDTPSRQLDIHTFMLYSSRLDILHVPKGYVSSIRSLEEKSRLLVMADYMLGEIKDEYRYDADYFL